MKKIVAVLISLLLISTAGCSKSSTCDPNGKVACYSKTDKSFLIEPDAKIKVAVRNAGYGEALVSLWNRTHRDHKGAVEYVEVDNYTAMYYMLNEDIDLMYLDYEEVPLIMDTCFAYTEELSDYLSDTLDEREFLVNENSMIFTPMEYQGLLFAYNQVMLDRLQVSHEQVESFEDILEMIKRANETDVFCFYPLSFTEKYSLYPLLTAGGFEMFSTNQADEVGFDSEEFLESLKFIYALKDYNLYPDTSLSAAQLPYALDMVLADNDTVFTLISNMMYINYEDENADYCFAKMPSYKGNTLTPLCDIYGYCISAYSDCPSAASELLRLIRSEEGLEAFISETDAVPYITEDMEIEDLDNERRQKSLAYRYSVTEPLIALETDTTKRVWDMYYEIDFLPVLRALYDHQIQPEKAQEEFVELAEDWLFEHGIEIEKETEE